LQSDISAESDSVSGLMSEYQYELYGRIDDSNRSSSPPIFVLCDSCYWSGTYFDKKRILMDNCPQCNNYNNNNGRLTTFPIMSDELFIFRYNDKSKVELEFKRR
jgi:Zn-finger nucleic acid-binding protein